MGSPEEAPRAWQLLRLGSRRHHRWGVLAVWTAVERFTSFSSGVVDVREGGLLRVSRARHHGAPVELRDGTVVCAGDPVLELHLANERAGRLGAEISPWMLLRMLRDDLRHLAAEVAAGTFGEPLALHGTTLLAAAGPRLGFERLEAPRTPGLRLHRFFFAGLVALHNPSGWQAAARKAKRWPAELWLSRSELLRRYGTRAADTRERDRERELGRSKTSASASPTSAISTSLTAR